MRRLRTAIAFTAVAVAATAVAGTAAGAQRALRLTEGSARFPDRSYVLTLPANQKLRASQVHVTENGERVRNLRVTPASAARADQLGVVLVIDASNSMRSPAIENALAAARAFAARRNPNQQLAVVTFNNTSAVVRSFTTDGVAIAVALREAPPLARGTHMYDAVAAALLLFEQAKIRSGSIVVLSDGADTGSTTTAAEVARTARGAHVRIFSVGLRGTDFDASALRTLALGAGGRYSEASSPRQLARIYDALGAELASDYLITYQSLAGPKTKVRVRVTVDGIGGAARTAYVTPALAVPTAGAPYHRPFSDTFWGSVVALLVVVLAAAGLMAFGLLALLRPQNGALRTRMAQFVALAPPASQRGQTLVSDRVFEGTERSLARMRWWARFKEELELAQIRVAPAQLVFWTVIGTLTAMFFFSLLLGSPVFSLIGLVVPLGVRAIIKRKLRARRKQFLEQLPDNLQVMASALRAGHSFVGALSVVADDAPEPSRTEFQRVIADEQLGVPLEDALDVVVRRMDCRDLGQVALVAALGRETGGNTAEVIDGVTETIRQRFELRRLVMTLTAQGRMSRWIVSLLPGFLLIAFLIINPDYISPLFTDPAGRIALAVATVLVLVGSFVIKRIVNIKV